MIGRDWKSALNAAANVAVIIASSAVVLAVWTDLRAIVRTAPVTSPAPIKLVSGAKAPLITGFDYGSSEKTLLLFMSVHCRYCQESVPFFRELLVSLAAAPRKAGERRLSAVFPEDPAAVNEFEERQYFRAEAIAGYDLKVFGITATPTIVLLSRKGRVLQVWRGLPNKSTQDEIRSALLSR